MLSLSITFPPDCAERTNLLSQTSLKTLIELSKNLQRAKITKQVSYHTFRHTFGTLLNANGENPKVVQELLRHASLKVTTDVYMQAVGPQKREAQSNLVKLVRRGAVLEIKPA